MHQSDDGLANARLAAIVDSSDDAIIGKDLNGIITNWNRAAERLFGYSADEAIGQHITLISLPGRESEMRDVLAHIARAKRVEHFETQRRHRDGSVVEVSLTVSPIHDHSGRVVGASKIARDIAERRRQYERQQFLLRELDHRAKNVLAVAQAMLRLTRADTVSDYVKAIEGRIRALAHVHGQMAENRWEGAELRALVDAEMEVFSEAGGQMTAEGESLWVSPAAAQVIAIILHELSTNAAKHGALSTAEGAVAVNWRRDESGDLQLTWTERGGPAVSEPTRRGFGAQVIERSVPDQLGGSAEAIWAPEGLRCRFTIPADQIVKPAGGQSAMAR